MMKKGILIVLTLFLFASHAMADNIAKEDETPPPPAGAMTADEITPITTLGKTLGLPAAPTQAPATTMPAPPEASTPATTPGGPATSTSLMPAAAPTNPAPTP